MSDDHSEQPSQGPQEPMGSDQESATDGWRHAWLIPAGTFLVGLLLGAVVIGLITAGDSPSSAAGPGQSPTPSVSTAPSPGEILADPITIPAECVQIANDTQVLLGLLDDAVSAVGELDAQRLSGIVDQLDAQQQALRAQASACQAAAPSASPTQ